MDGDLLRRNKGSNRFGTGDWFWVSDPCPASLVVLHVAFRADGFTGQSQWSATDLAGLRLLRLAGA